MNFSLSTRSWQFGSLNFLSADSSSTRFQGGQKQGNRLLNFERDVNYVFLYGRCTKSDAGVEAGTTRAERLPLTSRPAREQESLLIKGNARSTSVRICPDEVP